MIRLLISCLFALTLSATAFAQGTGGLVGRVESGVYLSPTKAYRIPLPVLQELGGSISDTENVVVFQDQFNVHLTIGCFQQDATQRWELSTRGLKDYLTAFFTSFAMPDFEQSFPGARVESTAFDAKFMDGSLYVSVLLPGGTMFGHRLASLEADAPVPVAKRGNLLFVRHGFVYVISIELAERVLEGTAYKLNTAEEDALLRRRIETIIETMEFARPAAAK